MSPQSSPRTGVRPTRRTFSAAALAVPGLVALSACGGSNGGGSSSGDASTIRVVDYYNTPADDEVIQSTLEAVASEVGVTINREKVPGDQLIQKVLQMSSSKTLPDILMLDNPDLQEIASSGALAPLEDFGIDTSGFKKEILDAGTYEGKVYGLAPTVNTIALFYNTALLEEAGVEPPTTWDDLKTAAAALTDGDVYGIAFSAIATYEGTWQFLPFMWSNGGDETDLGTPEVAGAAQLWADLVTEGSASKSVINWGQGDAMDQFKAGKAAMVVNGPWNINGLAEDAPDLSWDVVMIPVPEAGATSVAPLGGEVWTIPQTGDAEKQKKAAEVLQKFVSAENQLTMGAARNTIPANTDAAATFAEEHPELATFVEQVASARSRTGKLGPDWPTTAKAIYTANQQVLVDGVDPETAFAEAAASLG
ncbi:ABC transporter substrate-binding protein [Brachybacterium sp. J144]|uniref:sugar ABC transporter substrate-binding protein n=1 Tax=Brachybacterium sp. J144 TaxID=3116487 RepID=UPI002E7A692E|nr:ABC transporter substrate-binding protein [Brachybacterium sp. J144]MEE1650227.1 ABC transporter substrate-binding protein [Brachybacterium sp. J144]